MYNWFRHFCERLLRIPGAPEAPPGDESTTRRFRAAPKYFKYLVLLWAMQTTGLLLPLVSAATVFVVVSYTVEKQSLQGTPIVIAIFLVVLLAFVLQRLFRLAILRLDYEKRWYVVTDRSLRVREGVVGVQEITVTFANIQNLSISQGPIQRLLGIADLRVDTAGGGALHAGHGQDLHTAWFRGIDNAEQVRELIQQRLRRFKDSGLGDQEELGADEMHWNAEITSALREIYREASAFRAAVASRH